MDRGQLRHLIEHHKWESALSSIRTNPNVQADTTHTHRDGLALHLACDHDAPDDLILEILKLNTNAASHRGENGNLPLHIATRRNLSADVIEALIRANPAALDCRNEKGQTPRRLSHAKPSVSQVLNRPTYCLNQLLREEKIEIAQEEKLADLHKKVDEALSSAHLSNNSINEMSARVEQIKNKLKGGGAKAEQKPVPGTNGSAFDACLLNETKEMEVRLEKLLADRDAAEIREFMARAASQARSNNVLRMQKDVAEHAEQLMKGLDKVKAHSMAAKDVFSKDNLPRPL